MIRAVLFDMDGLMFDTERLAREAWLQVGREEGFLIDERILCQIRGSTPEASAAVFERAFGKSFDYWSARARRNRIVEDHIRTEGVPVKKGLRRLLNNLKDRQITCAVATSSPSSLLKRYLHISEIEQHFSALVSADQVQHSKPDPECYLMAASMLKVPPGECLVLEDSANGLRAAKAAGMQSVCVPDIALPDDDALLSASAVLNDLDEVSLWIDAQLGF